jgi:hypothetical protein
MLTRRSTNGIVYYVSPLLERANVTHAVSTRIGGKSPPPFDSLNLGNPSGCELQDDFKRVYENFKLMQAAIGCASLERLWVHQVHGGNVVGAMRDDGFENGTKGDALVSDDSSKVLSVRVADCTPVLIAGKDGRVVAAIHAGWRGVIAGIVPNAIAKMMENGCKADALIAAIGPGIGEEAFEVGEEVVQEFERVFGAKAPVRRVGGGKGRACLRSAIQMQLAAAGISSDHIDITDRCTFRDRDEFFSHRRERGITGRMAALIVPRQS